MEGLNSLSEAWDRVCQSMDNFGDSILSGNEEATRYALVDPILKALDWDLGNPEYVRLEWCQAKGLKPDYTCLKEGAPVLYVEAKCWGTMSLIKRLNNPLSSKEFRQLKKYCKYNSVKMGALTDGGTWYIVDFSQPKTHQIVAFIDAENEKKKSNN